MGNTPEEENLLELTHNSKRKGGVLTMPFIIVNESCERLASFGLLPNMIIYMTKYYKMEAAPASVILNLWSALSNGLAIFGAFVTDSYLGRFTAIFIGTTSSLMGTAVLWLTTMLPQLRPASCSQDQHGCKGTTAGPVAILLCSFGLISIGAGFVRPCSIAFGADQLEDKSNPDNERVIDTFFNWFYASVGVATLLSSTLMVYIQDHYGWQIGFGIPALLMVLSIAAFVMGSPLYIKVKAGGSLYTGLVQAAVAAYRKRHIDVQLNYDDDCYYKEPGSKILAPSTEFRYLNRACIIEAPELELKPDGTASNPWNLSSVKKVEALKSFIRIVPFWSTCIMVLVALGQAQYTIFQVNTMDRHLFPHFEIPAASIGTFTLITMAIWIPFYDRILVPVLSKFTGHPTGLSSVVRMGIGLIFSCLAMSAAAIIESIRRNKAIKAGFEDDPTGRIDMSAMWFLLQFGLIGLAEAFNVVGLIEFIYCEFPKSMSSFAAAIYTSGMALSSLIGSLLVSVVDSITSAGGKTSWLATNVNKGHVDYYYWLISFLCAINFLYFLVICRYCGHNHEGRRSLFLEAEEEDSQSRITYAA